MLRTLSTACLLVSFCVFLCTAGSPLIKGGEKILFIGNYITANGGGLDSAVRTTLAAASITVTADKYVEDRTELIDIYNHGKATAQIRSGKYDIVVLQDWINAEDDPTGSLALMFQAVQEFNSVITSTGGKTVLYMTYPAISQTRQSSEGISGLQIYSTIANIIAVNYDTASCKIGNAPVAPCGLAFRTMVIAPPPGQPDTLLYTGATSPSEYGQLLNAYVFFKTLTGKSPIGLKQTYYPGADPKIDSVLQYRGESITNTWMLKHKTTTNIERRVFKTEYSILNNTPSAPSYFLLDGSRFYPGIKITNDRISRMYISRNGNNAAINFYITGSSLH